MIQKEQLELKQILTPDISDSDKIQKDIEEIDRKILCLRTDGCVLIDDV